MKDHATHLLSSENYIIFKWTAIHNKLIKSNCFTIALLLLLLPPPIHENHEKRKTGAEQNVFCILLCSLRTNYWILFRIWRLQANSELFYIDLSLSNYKLKHDPNDSMTESMLTFFNTFEFFEF